MLATPNSTRSQQPNLLVTVQPLNPNPGNQTMQLNLSSLIKLQTCSSESSPNQALDSGLSKSRQSRATAAHTQKPTARQSGWQPFNFVHKLLRHSSATSGAINVKPKPYVNGTSHMSGERPRQQRRGEPGPRCEVRPVAFRRKVLPPSP